MSKPRLLDLFCSAGGAGMGYHLAGFEVIGVDIAPQRHYPFEFHQADAMTFPLDGFDVVHASPPCQDYSEGASISRSKKVHPDYPRLIAPMREKLQDFRGLWIIENVEGAHSEMRNPLMLCGTSLGLRVWRHRLFETNAWLFAAGPCQHRTGDVSVRTKHNEYIGIRSGVRNTGADGRRRWRPKTCPKDVACAAMGIEWMNLQELGEAVPPAYTQWLGKQLYQQVIGGKVA